MKLLLSVDTKLISSVLFCMCVVCVCSSPHSVLSCLRRNSLSNFICFPPFFYVQRKNCWPPILNHFSSWPRKTVWCTKRKSALNLAIMWVRSFGVFFVALHIQMRRSHFSFLPCRGMNASDTLWRLTASIQTIPRSLWLITSSALAVRRHIEIISHVQVCYCIRWAN